MERGIEFFDAQAAVWDNKRNTDEGRMRFLVSLLSVKRGGRILDVGSGTGVLLPYLLPLIGDAGRIVAVDFSAKMLEISKAKGFGGNITYKCADILEFELVDNSFDLIVSLNFFPHLTSLGDKRAYIKKAVAALAPGGQLVVMHDISRTQVNGVHEHKPETLNDKLPAVRDTGGLFFEAGLGDVFGIEDDYIYFLRGIK